MFDLLRRIGARHVRNKPARTFLTILAVALGIALTVAIGLINDAVLASFRESIASLAGTSALTVTAGETGFPEARESDIAKVPGVKSAIPRVEAWGYFAGDTTAAASLYILGVDMLREQSVRAYKSDAASEVMDDPLVFLNEPDSVILTKPFAAARGLHIGSTIDLATATGQITLTVRGLLEPEGPAKAYGGAIALMDIDGARVMLGKEGKTDAIDVVARPGVSVDALRASLRTALGPSFVIEAPEGYAHQLEQLVKPFQGSLAFFGMIALVVGLFLVGNAMSMSVAERRKEIGVLRALGATRAQIFGSLLAECVAIGAIGAVAGAYLGRALAAHMVHDVAESMTNQFSIRVSVGALAFDSATVFRALALGVGTAVIAGLLPILRATRISPTLAMRAQASVDRDGSAGRVWTVVGALGLALVVLTALVPSLNAKPLVAQAAQAGGVLGVALVAPALVELAMQAIRRLFAARTDVVPRLAAENVLRYRGRTRTNVVGLTLGLLFVTLIAGVSHSMRGTVLGWFGVHMRHDILVSSTGKLMQNASQPLSEDLAKDLADVPGVWKRQRTVDGIRFVHLEYEGRTIALKAFDEPDPSLHFWQFDARDRSRDAMGTDLYLSPDPTLIVSTNFVLHFGKKTGDYVTLDTPSGPTAFRVVGVVTDFASPEGVVYLARDRYKAIWGDPLVSGFGLYAAPGTDRETLRAELDRRFGRSKNLMFIRNDQFRDEFARAIDRSFAFADSLEWAALVVAMIGIFNTLTVGLFERTRELGMMRGIGMQRGQLARMIVLEATLQGAATALIAIVLGGGLSYWLVTDSLPATLGWVLSYEPPWATFGLVLGVGVLVAAIAGAYPAWRASRVAIIDALAYE